METVPGHKWYKLFSGSHVTIMTSIPANLGRWRVCPLLSLPCGGYFVLLHLAQKLELKE